VSDRTRWAGIVRDPVHGPLPGLLFVLTAVTGVIDAVSLLTLGRVFVANITGTIVTLGLALAGTLGIVRATALVALATFVLGAYAGGQMIIHFGGHRGRLLLRTLAVELVFVVVAIPVTVTVPLTATVVPELSVRAVVAAAILAFAMGMQIAVVRRLKVPDMNTTVVTMVITGLAADAHGGGRASFLRRLVAVLMLLVGAALGAFIVLRAGPAWALAVAALMIVVVLVVAALASRVPQDWHAPR
jgi:uncharacterized membrane protein YoaK (UPF0700 family)